MKSTNDQTRGKRRLKLAGLAAVLALGLTLTACYIPPDEISNTQNMTIGSDTLPFQTVEPQVTNTPTPSPAPADSQSGIDTQDGWTGDGTVTNTPSQAQQTIVVVTATPTAVVTTVPPSPTPTPTTVSNTLKRGTTGDRVKQLQQRLKELGYYRGSVDGSFGENTENAVKAFQAANGLKADGVVGNQTMTRLYAANAKPYSSANSTATPRRNAATRTPRPTATPNLTKATYLKAGSTGKRVKQLQQRLIDLGWMGGKADGEYGGATEAAIRAFQKKTSGLYEDGIAGPETQATLFSASAPRSSTMVSSVGETLREGSEGKAVRALQTRLKKLGYYRGTVDGSYGAATVEAVKAFQRNNGLTADGAAGTATLNKLYSDSVVSADGSAGMVTTDDRWAEAGSASTGYTTLRTGDSGEAVSRLQQRLKDLGLYSRKVDGNYGSGTADAVRAFQQAHDLRADGVAGPATQRALYDYRSTAAYTTLRPGDMNSSVSSLQHALRELGYYDDEITGVYGETTSDAVRAFQMTNGMKKVDGVAGSETLQALYSGTALGVTALTYRYETVRSGDTGESVVELQDVLQQLGYMDLVTGVYDGSTVAAVQTFQRNNGLKADGVAGAATQRVLYSDNPVPNY